MSYVLTLNFNNGYRCRCCRHDWSNEEDCDTLEEAARLIHEAKNQYGNDEFDGYSIRPAAYVSEAESSALAQLVKDFQDDEDRAKAEVAARKEHDEKIASIVRKIESKQKHLDENRHMYNETALAQLEDEIEELKIQFQLMGG